YYTAPLNGYTTLNPTTAYFDGSFNSNRFSISGPGEPQPGSNINILTDPYFGLVTSYSTYSTSDCVIVKNAGGTAWPLPNPPNIYSISWSLWTRSISFSALENVILSNSGSSSWLAPTFRFSSATWNTVTLDIIGQSPCATGTLAALNSFYPMDNGWHFIVFTLNGTGNFYNFSIYLDGILPITSFTQNVVNASAYSCGSFTQGSELGDVQAKNYVGSYALFTQYNFTLSPSQVSQLYQAQKPSCLSACYAFGATSQSCQNIGGNYSLGPNNGYGCFVNPMPLAAPISFSSLPSSLIGSYPLVNSLTNYVTCGSLTNSTVTTYTSGTRGTALTLTGSFTLSGDINIGPSYSVCIWISVTTFGGGNTLWTIIGNNA